ncbi:hypothetical protein BD309DRAFT_859046 [Dichomitus squalens]|nr:hypothetical protein BD309DRAFT_859046 [Dichomitus squalens]
MTDDPTAPLVCQAWEAKVASCGVLDGFVFTSPNMEFVSEYPVFREVITTYEDGRWGVHEYSRWPQPYVEGMHHIACIPRQPNLPHLPRVLFKSLYPKHDWAERTEVMVRGLGFISEATRAALSECARVAIERFQSMAAVRSDIRRYGNFLVMMLRQVVDRMNYVASHPRTAIAVAAHVQRICLELAGLKTYAEEVAPGLEDTKDWSTSQLPVLGGFVRDLPDAQTWCRVGLPVWLIQPISPDLVVWQAVDTEGLPGDMSKSPCSPPILHKAGTFVGAPNVTGNWLTGMLMSVSKHVGGCHLDGLHLAAVLHLPDGPPDNKRARVESKNDKPLTMRPAISADDGSTSKKKKTRRGRKISKGMKEEAPNAKEASAESSGASYPSSAVPKPWVLALSATSPLKEMPNSALYFYPPPFLLDTISSVAGLFPNCPHPDRARIDEKAHRYLHNLARIREFCRTRLFDESMGNRPLSIGEWRSALFGDYAPRTHRPKGPETSEVRREIRRQNERNEISALFHQVGHIESYTPDICVALRGMTVDVESIAVNPEIRATLLWEAHELNFRADICALDRLQVDTSNWSDCFQWEREMLLSGIWGEPSSGVSVLPSLDSVREFCWYAPPDERWRSCRRYLLAFIQVLCRWRGCPEVLLEARRSSGEMLAAQYVQLQQCAADFYVRSFIRDFARLPVPPIPYPL